MKLLIVKDGIIVSISQVDADFNLADCQHISVPGHDFELVNDDCMSKIGDSVDSALNPSPFKNYRKKSVQPMRPYVPGEDMTHISVSESDTLEEGGMVAVNPENQEDRWYVAKKFFEDNYELSE